MKNISCWMASAALCALPLSAMAQEADTAPPSDNSYSGGLADIIVTAEKREVDLQSLSQAVSAYTSDARQLAGIATLQDLANFTPGLSYSAGNDRVFIRGIGRQTNTNGSDPGVSTYTDGIYDTATASVSASDFFIERVEILRGPQGTLYGRNSIGGAINAISKRPTEDFTADVRATVANYDVFNLEAAVSGSLTPGLRLRVAGGHYEQDKGYFKSTVGNPSEGNRGTRRYAEVQLEADLGENVSLWLKGFTGGTNMYPRPLNRIGDFDFAPYPSGGITPGAGFGYANPGSLVALDPNPFPAGSKDIRKFSTDTVQRERMRDNFGFAGDITFSAPTFDVRLLGGYQEYKVNQIIELDGTSVRSYEYPLLDLGFASACDVFLTFLPFCAPLTARPSSLVDFNNNKSFGSGELTFTSTTTGPLQWTAGLYYYEESLFQETHFQAPEQLELRAPVYLIDIDTFTTINAPANPLGDFVYSASDIRTKSYAAYAQLNYEISDQLRVTGGLRYTKDKKRGTEYLRIVCMGCEEGIDPGLWGVFTPVLDVTVVGLPTTIEKGATGLPTINPITGVASRGLSNSWDAVTGTMAIEYAPSDDQLAFLRYSRGYKSGGFNAGGISEFPQTNSEYINAYEAGYKHKISNRVRANLALFYYDYKDLQVPLTVNTPGGAQLTQFFNLRKSESYGAELELAWQATDALQLMFNYAYGDSKIKEACCFVDGEDPTATQPGTRPVGTPVDGLQGQSVAGAELPETPRHKIAANAQYSFFLDAGTLTFSGSYMWKDSSYANIFNRSYNRIPSTERVDLRAIWSGKKDSYRIIAYAKNIFDSVGYDSASGDLLLSPVAGRVAQSYSLTPPRTFGLQLDISYR
jgi:iron complex outermembrane receptor protein